MDVSELRERLGRNTDTVMRLKGIRSRAALARALDRDPATITRLLNGGQEWTLTDIVTIGELLGLSDPFLLAGDTATVVAAAVHPSEALAAGEVTGTLRGSRGYPPAGLPARVLAFPQVTDAGPDLNRPARVIPLTRPTSRQTKRLISRPSHLIRASLAQLS